MKRMGEAGRNSGALERDMSYTNLAAMAEQFGTYQRVLPAGVHQAQRPEASYAQAMELINTGLRLDATAPLEAVAYYQRGGDMLSRVLESVRRDTRAAAASLARVLQPARPGSDALRPPRTQPPRSARHRWMRPEAARCQALRPPPPTTTTTCQRANAGWLSQPASPQAPPDEESDKMQRTLDMIEERVRFITRTIIGRNISDSQVRLAEGLLPPRLDCAKCCRPVHPSPPPSDGLCVAALAARARL